jgi:hypothetical protein
MGHRRACRSAVSSNQSRLENVFLDSRADDSAGLNEKENPPTFYAVPIRALSPRQLPTNHVPAVLTREYQNDPSSRNALGCHWPCGPKHERRPYPPAPPPPPTLRCAKAPLRLRSAHSNLQQTVIQLLTCRSISKPVLRDCWNHCRPRLLVRQLRFSRRFAVSHTRSRVYIIRVYI